LGTSSEDLNPKVSGSFVSEDGPVFYTDFDVSKAIENDSFANGLGPASPDDIELFEEKVGSGPGTIVTLKGRDRLTYKSIDTYVDRLKREFGRIYRHFLKSNLRIMINGEAVKPIDPLYWDHPDTEQVMDKTITYAPYKGASAEHIRIKIAKLPDFGAGMNRELKINQANQGIYISRNMREIAKGLTLNMWTKHNSYNRIRAELEVSGRLDEQLGVNFMKRDIKIEQGLEQKLQSVMASVIETAHDQLIRRESKTKAKELKHEGSEKLIESKSRVLIKPEQVTKSEPNEPKIAYPHTTLRTKFDHEGLRSEGPIYSVEVLADHMKVIYNADHPFFKRFLLDNSDNQSLVEAVDALMTCLAAVEVSYPQGSSQRQMFDTFKAMLNNNVRVLLG
jgi:hypothetical protein